MAAFFRLAAQSRSRQKLWRQLVALHLATLAVGLWAGFWRPDVSSSTRWIESLGHASILLWIVEGSLLVGWRLTQWPKSQSIELVLVTSRSPVAAMLGEQVVGLSLLALVSLSALPIYIMAWQAGWLDGAVPVLFPAMGWLWGSLAGFGLVSWAYEPRATRRFGERLAIGAILIYLSVGALMGERTFHFLSLVPWGLGEPFRDLFWAFHWNNPFALIHRLARGGADHEYWRSWVVVHGLALLLLALVIARAAFRLKPHAMERHERKPREARQRLDRQFETSPLTWWAVRRVREYSGQINVYLALGTAVLQGSHLLLGPLWPSWLGSDIFLVFDRLGGVPGLVTGMVLLGFVPAAYQFGLWDANDQDRRRRLELLLLTDLNQRDYLRASWFAAWDRGRGYLAAAGILAAAAWWSGTFGTARLACLVLAVVALGAFSFSLGFTYLARRTGAQVGFVLSVVLPALVWGIGQWSPGVAAFLPAGAVYYALARGPSWEPMLAIVFTSFIAAAVLWRSRQRFDADLRAWYDGHGSAA